jgi:hypothetical protein
MARSLPIVSAVHKRAWLLESSLTRDRRHRFIVGGLWQSSEQTRESEDCRQHRGAKYSHHSAAK